jgi:hypothetical protein
MDMTNARLCLIAVLACIATPAAAQSPESLDLTAVGKDPRWKIAGRTTSIVDIKGKHALKVSEAEGTGVVWLEGYDFGNGAIEADMLGRSQPVQGSFLGVAFRVVDAQTHDAVYFRPFNFRAADPARHSHAVQYVSHPRWPWQTLRSEHPNTYERAVVPEPDGDEWFHVRVVVERPKVSVFVNGASAPCLVVQELSDRVHGSLGLWVGEGSGGHFANLRVTRAR